MKGISTEEQLRLKTEFEDCLSCINRDKTDTLLGWLNEHHFFEVPASCNYHNNFRYGLLKHSIDVYHEGLKIYYDTVSKTGNEDYIFKDSIAVACLLHDICKWNVYYISPYDNAIKKNVKAYSEGHGLKSIRILEKIGYPLTEQEKLAIWWHMGQKYEPSYKCYTKEYELSTTDPLCNLVRNADRAAAGKA